MLELCSVTLAVVNIMEPKEAYKEFENDLLEQLPADQPEFILLLEKEGVIDGEAKKEMNTQDENICVILEEIEKSLLVSHEKFYKLLSAMKEYNHGVETLAQKIENYLDPGIVYINYTYIATYLYT